MIKRRRMKGSVNESSNSLISKQQHKWMEEGGGSVKEKERGVNRMQQNRDMQREEEENWRKPGFKQQCDWYGFNLVEVEKVQHNKGSIGFHEAVCLQDGDISVCRLRETFVCQSNAAASDPGLLLGHVLYTVDMRINKPGHYQWRAVLSLAIPRLPAPLFHVSLHF